MEVNEDEDFCSNCKRYVSSANFASHSAFCERNIYVCKICDEPVQISEKNQHLEEYHVIGSCNQCEQPLEKWMLPRHMESCPRRLIVCSYCKAEVPYEEHSEHNNFCGSRTEKCMVCQKYVMLKEKDMHTKIHEYDIELKRKNIGEEIRQNKVNEVMCQANGAKKDMAEKVPKSKYDQMYLEKEKIGKVDQTARKDADISLQNRLKNKVYTEDKRFEIPISEGAVASPPDKTKISKHYTECHICKQVIRWIDMNTHIPSCASSSGRCSVCGEKVASHEIKKHMEGHFHNKFGKPSLNVLENAEYIPDKKTFSRGDFVVSDEVVEDAIECPYCSQLCSKDRIHDHVETCTKSTFKCQLCFQNIPEADRVDHETFNCKVLHDRPNEQNFARSYSEIFYECPLCGEKVPDENRDKHVSFECKNLLDDGANRDNFGFREDSSDLYQCPLCLEEMLMQHKNRHESFECKVLIESSEVDVAIDADFKSYADVTKEECCNSCKCKKSEVCHKCKNNIPKHKMSEHLKSCERVKFSCPHCHFEIDATCSEIHLRFCPGLASNRLEQISNRIEYKDLKSRTSESSQTLKYEDRGAIPKHASISDMVKTQTAKCAYCKTALNANIIKYHENECIHRPVECPNCDRLVPVKDLESHKCKSKKGKGKNRRTDCEVSERKNSSSLGGKLLKYFTGEKKEEKHEYRHQPVSFPEHNYNQHETTNNEDLYFAETFDALIPCEFCQKKFPASKLVLHETGCEPDLVCFAKPNSSDNTDPRESSNEKDLVSKQNSKDIQTADVTSSFFAPNTSFIPSARYEHLEQKKDSNYKPGEFLKPSDKSSYQNEEKKENVSDKKKKECLKLISVWNKDNSHNPEDGVGSVTSSDSDIEMDIDRTEPAYQHKSHERDIQHEKQATEKLSCGDSDEEMNAVFSFLNEDSRKTLDNKAAKTQFEVYGRNSKSMNLENEEPVSDSNSLDSDTREKTYRDMPVSKMTAGEKSKIMPIWTYGQNSEHMDKVQKEYLSNLRHLQKMKFDISGTEALHAEDDLSYINLPEKNSEMPEMCKQNTSKYASGSKDLDKHSSGKRLLADFKFGSRISNLSSKNTAQYEEKDENVRLYMQKTTKYGDNSRNEKEYVSNIGHLTDSEFSSHALTALAREDYFKNVHSTKESSKDCESSYSQINSRYSNNTKDRKKHASSPGHIEDFQFRTQMSKALHSDDNTDPIFPRENNHDPQKIATKARHVEDFQLRTQMSKALHSDNNTDPIFPRENNHDPPQKTTKARHIEDFLFKAQMSKALHSDDNTGPIFPRENNHDPQKIATKAKYFADLLKQQTKISNSSHLTYSKSNSSKSAAFSNKDEIQYADQREKNNEEGNLSKQSTLKYDTQEEKDYLRNFKQHLPDFKYNDSKSRLSLRDNAHYASLLEEKTGHNKNHTFKQEPVVSAVKEEQQLVSGEDLSTFISQKAREIEDLEERIAKLKEKTKLREIEDMEEKVAKLKERHLNPVEKDDITKWKQWRSKKSPACSDSD